VVLESERDRRSMLIDGSIATLKTRDQTAIVEILFDTGNNAMFGGGAAGLTLKAEGISDDLAIAEVDISTLMHKGKIYRVIEVNSQLPDGVMTELVLSEDPL